jgi:hypothetical protein
VSGKRYTTEIQAEVVRLYVEDEQSCAEIARTLGKSKAGVEACLRRQGVVLRDSSTAALLTVRHRDEGAVRPPREPRLCICGCGQWTTGYQRRSPKDGKSDWEPPEYVAGHFKHTAGTMPLRSLKFDYSKLRCAA